MLFFLWPANDGFNFEIKKMVAKYNLKPIGGFICRDRLLKHLNLNNL